MPEIEVFSVNAELRERNGGGIATELVPGEGRFVLLAVLSGMVRGEMRLADGRIPFTTSKGGGRCAILLIPPGGILQSEFAVGESEAFAFEFACPSLLPQPSRMRLELKCGDGAALSLFFASTLSSYDAAILRPSVWRAYKDLVVHGTSGRRLRGVINVMALLSQLFAVPRNMEYWGSPAVVLQKSMEANPRGSTVIGMSRKLGCSPGTLRRKFSERTPGMTPSDYKLEQTLHMMRYYILETALPFKAIARQIGFKSASHFTRYSVRYLGVTPSAIRTSGRFPDGYLRQGKWSSEKS